VFLGCALIAAQLIGAGVTVTHHKQQSGVRTVIELIPFPLGYMILISFSQNFSLARLEMRNSGMQLDFINHSYIFLYFMFFLFQKPVAKVYQIMHKIA